MKATGIIRRVDDLGRVVITKEVRRRLRIKEGDPLELFLEDDKIIFRKYDITSDVKQLLSDAESCIRFEADLPTEITNALLSKLKEMQEILSKEDAINENNKARL